MLLRLLACSAAFALLAAAPAAARPKRPDLVVRLLARPPAQLNPGAKLEVRVRVDNVGRGRAPRSLVTLHLSRDARLGRGDVRLPGSFRARALAGARASAATGTLGTTVPARAAPGRYRLLACVDAGDALSEGNERNNCAAAPVLLVVPPPLEEVAAPAFAAPPPTFAAPPAGTQTVAGRVSYLARDCTNDTPRPEPFADGTVRLSAGGQDTIVALDGTGAFSATVPAGDVQVFARTLGPHVAVGPDADPYAPYEIALGPLVASGQRFVIAAAPAAGAASVLEGLESAARVAAAVWPVPLPPIRARWRYPADLTGWLGDSGSEKIPDEDAIRIGGRLDGSHHDEWERSVLAHEYGHHLLAHVASPDAGGDHDLMTVDRDHPELAWSEGFADAFAAMARNDPGLRLGCGVVADFTASPAAARSKPTEPLAPMPPAPFEHLAQYNEVTVGAAVYDAALEMGAGDARAGFRMLLRALSGFAARHHPPRDLREVRDALIEDGGIETTGAQTQAIGDAFARQNIAWGYLQGAVVPVVDNVRTEVQARVTGPATCIKAREGDPNDPDLRIAFYGPLGFTHHDDCFSWADGDPFDEGDSNDGAVQWDLPYLPGQGHRSGEFTASLRYTCVPLDDPCPAVLNVAWSATTLSWLASEPLFSEAAMLRAWAQRDLILRRDEWLDVARFDARGRCTTIPGGTSCGT